ncbi:MAG: tripartite tricarboxylate transporter TctB family protein [Proteobacteria bacterium]|nr:tripartite tricarboxylate transporter TctB family protein [Pseudomonadota bacterium]MBU4277470.1 tripartite tricarboxylate transporter TctB family protein [Pseudomonadota bacterium]MBU4384853.1 tripartite tricarboxylate transporter TctB family protein [Pseudomonadota bacterium]MBU4604644.1 tripartite tricarboxylate transporter TctB family protein [Pseudomonadota bacterium]MCG2764697.1 tripartite tricarboxylate transporter TctB family protein [Desulfarculaceae bacterium]
MNRDAIVGLVCLVMSAVLYATLGHIEEPRAAAFPRTIIITMGALSALMLLQHLLFPKPQAKQSPFPWIRVGGLFVIIIVYLALLEVVGFYLASFLFFMTVVCIMGFKRLTVKQTVSWVLGSVIFTAILFILFSVLLEVQTPRGLLI